jgi:predicted ATPase/serine/threonine protein kinase
LPDGDTWMSQPQQTIGPYRILGTLGRGGQGVVLLGEHQGTGLKVAVKTVPAPRQELLEGIRREVHALARIRHPGVVRILAEGMDGGVPWYAMELVEGRDLRAVRRGLSGPDPAEAEAPTRSLELPARATDGGQWPAAESPEPGSARTAPLPPLPAAALLEALGVVRRLCGTLAYLHGEGIVHRDLKPGNILIRAASGEQRAARGSENGSSSLAAPRSQLAAPGWPVLVDFGLASRFAGPLGREALELGGSVSGTAAYMAPEQVQGQFVDARADLYAVGCVLFELIAGRPPFVGKTASAVMRGHLEAVPPRLSELRDGVPAELEALVQRLLAKRPEERLGHADDVAAALAGLGAANGFAEEAPRPRAYLYRPRFAGRAETIEAIGARLRRLGARGGDLVLVGGESGVGKTRLVMEAAREARERGVGVVLGECLPVLVSGEQRSAGGEQQHDSALAARSSQLAAPGSPLQPLRKLLQQVADRCRELGPAETERLLGREAGVLALYEPALSGLPGLDADAQARRIEPLPPEAARLRLFSGLADVLSAMSERQRLLLVLDDLHWADELTLGFLEHLLRFGLLRQMRCLLLGTYRVEEAAAHRDTPLQRLLEDPAVQRLELGRLDERAVGHIVGDMLALHPPPQVFARFLTRQSEGNPFFVAEYLRSAVAEGLLYRDEAGSWQVAARDASPATEALYAALPLPGSIRELVERRLEGLGAWARTLVEAATVLGRELDPSVLADMARMDEAERLEALQELLARQVLEETAEGALRFVHDKIREVSSERLSAERRLELHRAAAEAIELRSGARREEHAAVLAHHWEQAREAVKAGGYALVAARRAKARYEYREAERLYTAYFRLKPEATAESAEVRRELGQEVLHLQGRSVEAGRELRQALEEARRLGARQAEVRTLLAWSRIDEETGKMQEARGLCEQALELARELADRRLEAQALDMLAVLEADRGRLDESCVLLEQALDLHRELGDGRSEGRTLNNLAKLQSKRGRLQEAPELYRQALEIYRRLGDRRAEGIVLTNFGALHLHQGHLGEARDLWQQALAIHREIGNQAFEGMTLYDLALVGSQEGRAEEAIALHEQALAIARRVGDRRSEGITLGQIANLRAAEGRVEQALELYEQALAIDREVENWEFLAVGLGDQSNLLRQIGQIGEAALLVEQAEQTLQKVGDEYSLVGCLCHRGHLLLAEGVSARSVLERAEGLAAKLGIRLDGSTGRATVRLRGAVEAFEASRPLFRGELREGLPTGLRRRLAESGQFDEAEA